MKILRESLGILLLVLLLSACSGGGGGAAGGNDVEIPEGATEVVMWNLFGGGDAEYMQEIVDSFNDSQSEFFVNNIMQENEEYYTKLLTSIGAGKGPDVAIAHSFVLPELVNQGLVTDVGDVAETVGINWDEFNQNILASTVFDDIHYAVPIDTHAQIMYINNDLVGEAGLLNEDGTINMETTPEGYMEFFQKLDQELPEDTIPFAFSSTGNDPYWLWWTFYTQMGGRGVLTEDSLENPEWDLDMEKAIEAAEFVKSLYHENEIVPLNISDFYAEFQAENAATLTTGVWATGIWEATEDLAFTPMPIPTLFEQEGAWGAAHTLVLPYYEDVDAKVQEGAVEFMNFATENGAMWAEAGHIPAKTTVVESQEFKDLPYREEYAEVAGYVNFVDQNIYARGVEEIIVRHLDTVWAGDVTAESAFEAIKTEVTDLIGG